MDASHFIGRFHPVIVHLPIGFIVMAIIFYFRNKFTKEKGHDSAVRICLGWATTTGVVALLSGWLLSDAGQYSSSAVSLHKWLAIATVSVTAILYLLIKFRPDNKLANNSLVLSGLAILLILTGHNGGNITHGPDYLVEHAPSFIQKTIGYNASSKIQFDLTGADTIRWYDDLIVPLFQQKCISCHGDSKQQGNFNLQRAEQLFLPADEAVPVMSGQAKESELYKRMTLPHNDKKYMPPNGRPMNFTDIALIKEWIDAGADTNAILDPAKISSELQSALNRDYGIDFAKKSIYETTIVNPISVSQKKDLVRLNFSVDSLSQTNHFLDVSFQGEFEEEHHLALESISDNLTWLKISKTDLSMNKLKIHKLPFLTKLDLSQSTLPSDIFNELKGLSYLEVVNLFGTNIDLEQLDKIMTLPKLSRLYIGQTALDSSQIDAVRKMRLDVIVID